jgi:hypothetical protein
MDNDTKDNSLQNSILRYHHLCYVNQILISRGFLSITIVFMPITKGL